MKLLSSDPTEHTGTFELDNGYVFTAIALREEIIVELEKELGIAPHSLLDTNATPLIKEEQPVPKKVAPVLGSIEYLG